MFDKLMYLAIFIIAMNAMLTVIGLASDDSFLDWMPPGITKDSYDPNADLDIVTDQLNPSTGGDMSLLDYVTTQVTAFFGWIMRWISLLLYLLLNIAFGLTLAMIRMGVPAEIVFIVSAIVLPIQAAGLFYFFAMIISAVRGRGA